MTNMTSYFRIRDDVIRNLFKFQKISTNRTHNNPPAMSRNFFSKCRATVRHYGNLDSQPGAPPAAQLIKAITSYVLLQDRRRLSVRINQVKLSAQEHYIN